jgi:hypothetical protein
MLCAAPSAMFLPPRLARASPWPGLRHEAVTQAEEMLCRLLEPLYLLEILGVKL